MKLRGALLGAGNIALAGHLPAYEELKKRGIDCEIVAGADCSHENLGKLSRAVPGIATFATAVELFRVIRPDFVDICAPPSQHRALIEQSLGAGCHVLCEKPLSLTIGEARSLSAHVRATRQVFVPCHQYHYAPAWSGIRSSLEARAIGELRYATITVERTQANPGNDHWDRGWRTRGAVSGGGVLMDHGAHLFYQLRSLLGDPTRIAARIEKRRHFDYDVEDTASCYFDFGVSLVRVFLTWAGRRRRTVHRYFGDAGTLVCDDEAIEIVTTTGVQNRPLDDGGFVADSAHSAWYLPLLLDFVDRIERGDLSRAPLDEAVAALRWIAAAYESARLGRPIVFGESIGFF